MRAIRVWYVLCLWTTTVVALWPQPQQFRYGSSVVWLSPDVKLEVVNEKARLLNFDRVWSGIQKVLPYTRSNNNSDDISISDEATLHAAFDRAKATILTERFVPRKFHPRKSTFEPEIDNVRHMVRVVTIRLISPAKFPKSEFAFITDEAYSLNISEDGTASIATTSLTGGLHALQTFTQLFYAYSNSDIDSYSPYVPVNIVDGPSFKHRGLNLDISRNWIPPSDVLRVIEAMATAKMNRLHIHATDAQSWPLEIPSLPDLALEGAYDISQIWTAENLRQVQRHGKLHGVEVFVEIDIPGHTTSIAASQPELITAAHREPWHVYADEPPSGQLSLNSTAVYKFLTTLFNDIMPRNARSSSLFHFGGDEVNLHAYGLDPTTNSTSKAVLQPLLQSLMTHVFRLAATHALTPIVWEELLLEWNLTLPAAAIVQTWRSNEALAPILARGHRVLFGANTHWYLDCGLGTWLDPADPLQPGDSPRVRPPYPDWCPPYKNWRHVYSYDPLKGIADEHRGLVLGGEVHLWGEMTDPMTLDGMLWPRAAAAAEVLWRGPGTPVSEDTTRRLAEWRERVLLKGVRAGMVQMEWCLRNRGSCTM